MTLDEKIKYFEEVAEEKGSLAKRIRANMKSEIALENADECETCAEEYHQLAKWLKELRELREKVRWIPISEGLPEIDGEYHVIENGGRVGTYVFRKEGNSEEYWNRCVAAWQPSPESCNEELAEQSKEVKS